VYRRPRSARPIVARASSDALYELDQELPRHACLKQSIAVLHDHRWNPHHPRRDRRTSGRAAVVALLHHLPFRPDGIERLQQKRPRQSLRRDRRSDAFRVSSEKIAVERCRRLVHNAPHQPLRVFGGKPVFQGQRRKTVRPSSRPDASFVPPTTFIRGTLPSDFPYLIVGRICGSPNAASRVEAWPEYYGEHNIPMVSVADILRHKSNRKLALEYDRTGSPFCSQ
jgi:hypothetical protein